MRHFLLAALAVCSLLPLPTNLDALAYYANNGQVTVGEIVEPSEAEALGPVVDERMGRTWKVAGLFGTGSAGLVHIHQVGPDMYSLYFLSAAHVTNENGTRFALINEVHGLHIGMASASFVHPTEDAVILSAVVDAKTAAACLPLLMDLRWENLNLGERVLLDGFGAGDRWISEGRVSAPRRISIDLFFGDSGSPLQDAEGRVCGIVVMRGPAPHHGHIVPMVAIQEWMDSLAIR